MKLQVISEEFEEVTSEVLHIPFIITRIKVLVDDELLVAEGRHVRAVVRNVPSEVLMGALRSKIMVAIEQKLFNDYNPRTIH